MGAWSDALAKVRTLAATRGNVPGTTLPQITNRDASGLLLFARAATAWARDHGKPDATFDWYGFALPALGFRATGDKFKIDEAQQLAPYSEAAGLWTALDVLATQFDAAGVPFDVSKVGSPMGSDTSFRKLASDAWDVMKKSDPAAREGQTQVRDGISTAQATGNVAKKKRDNGSGLGALLLVGALVYALSDEKRTHRR